MKNCMLFKIGTAHTIRGIDCNFVVVSSASVESHLKLGYFKTPEDLYLSIKAANKKAPKEAPEKGLKTLEIGDDN